MALPVSACSFGVDILVSVDGKLEGLMMELSEGAGEGGSGMLHGL